MLIYNEELGGRSYFAVPEFSLVIIVMAFSIAAVLLAVRFKNQSRLVR